MFIGRAMRQMAAGRQSQAKEGVARLQQGEIDRLIGLAARVGLHVGIGTAEQRLGAFDGE
jgi:hypothetical protein